MRKFVSVTAMCAVVFGVRCSYAEGEYHEEDMFDMFRPMTTLGQLCKTSDLIITGKLKGKKTKADHETEYTFQVERVLDGKTKARAIAVHGSERGLDEFTLRRITTNATCIVFCSHTDAGYSFVDIDKLLSLSFEKAKMPGRVTKWFITANDRGAVQVDDGTADAYEQAVTGHLEQLRTKDVSGYFDFLRGLSKSDVERIRRDALEDLYSLMRHSASEGDLAKILARPDLTEEEKALAQKALNAKQGFKRLVEEAKRERERDEKLKKNGR